jgi:hypothetical protein
LGIKSPGGYGQQEMDELGDVFGICAVAEKEVPSFDEFFDLFA